MLTSAPRSHWLDAEPAPPAHPPRNSAPIRPPARQVPGAVHPAPCSVVDRNKPLRRQPARPNIHAPGHSRDVKLPLPQQGRAPAPIQHVNRTSERPRPADCQHRRRVLKRNMADMHSRLGDAVHVDQRCGAFAVTLVPVFGLRVQRLAAEITYHNGSFCPRAGCSRSACSGDECRRRLVEMVTPRAYQRQSVGAG